jgi:hypothetical protein
LPFHKEGQAPKEAGEVRQSDIGQMSAYGIENLAKYIVEDITPTMALAKTEEKSGMNESMRAKHEPKHQQIIGLEESDLRTDTVSEMFAED